VPDLLRVLILGVNNGMQGDEAAAPIEIHEKFLSFNNWPAWKIHQE
jgi:hypothetical protein